MPRKSASSARGGRAVASARRTTRKTDFSDIPEASNAQLSAMRRGYQMLINEVLAKHARSGAA